MHINKLCRVHLMDRICRADCRTRRSTGEHWVMLTDRHQPPVHCDRSPTYGICWLKVPSHPFDRRKCVFNRQDRQTVFTGLVPLFDRDSRGVALLLVSNNCPSRSLFSQKSWHFVTTRLIWLRDMQGCCWMDAVFRVCLVSFCVKMCWIQTYHIRSVLCVCSYESCSTSTVPLFRCFM